MNAGSNEFRRTITLELQAQGAEATASAVNGIMSGMKGLVDENGNLTGSYQSIIAAVQSLAKAEAAQQTAAKQAHKAQQTSLRGLEKAYAGLDKTIGNVTKGLLGFSVAGGVTATIGSIIGATQTAMGTLKEYNQTLLQGAAISSQYGMGITELEGRMTSMASAMKLTRQESLQLLNAYQKTATVFSQQGFESMTANIASIVGPNSQAIGEMTSELNSLISRFPDLQSKIESADAATRRSAQSDILALAITGEITNAELRRFSAYVQGAKQMSEADIKAQNEKKRQLEIFQQFARHTEHIRLLLAEAMMPLIQRLSDWLEANRDKVASFFDKFAKGVQWVAEKFDWLLNNAEKVKVVLAGIMALWVGSKLAGPLMAMGGALKGAGAMAGAGKAGAMLAGAGRVAGAALPAAAAVGIGYFGGRMVDNYVTDATGSETAGNIAGIGTTALGGAAAGFMLGGPVGAVIGGLAGTALGIWRTNKDQLEEQKKAREQAAAAANAAAGRSDADNMTRDRIREMEEGGAGQSTEQDIRNARRQGVDLASDPESNRAAIRQMFEDNAAAEAFRDAFKRQVEGYTDDQGVYREGTLDRDERGYAGSLMLNGSEERFYGGSRDRERVQELIGGTDEDIATVRGRIEGATTDDQRERLLAQLQELRSTRQSLIDMQRVQNEVVARYYEQTEGKTDAETEALNRNRAALQSLAQMEGYRLRLAEKMLQIRKEMEALSGLSQSSQGQLQASIEAEQRLGMGMGFDPASGMGTQGFIDQALGDIENQREKNEEFLREYNNIMSSAESREAFVTNTGTAAAEQAEKDGADEAAQAQARENAMSLALIGLESRKRQVLSENVQLRTQEATLALKIAETFAGELAVLEKQSSLTQSIVELTDNFALGVGASAQMRTKLVQSYQQEIELLRQQYDTISASATIDTTEKRQLQLDIENKILQKQNAQAQQLKALRDGWISALGAMNTGAGRFTKIMISQEQNLESSARTFEGVISSYSGAVEEGYEASAKFSGMSEGQIAGNQSGLAYETHMGRADALAAYNLERMSRDQIQSTVQNYMTRQNQRAAQGIAGVSAIDSRYATSILQGQSGTNIVESERGRQILSASGYGSLSELRDAAQGGDAEARQTMATLAAINPSNQLDRIIQLLESCCGPGGTGGPATGSPQNNTSANAAPDGQAPAPNSSGGNAGGPAIAPDEDPEIVRLREQREQNESTILSRQTAIRNARSAMPSRDEIAAGAREQLIFGTNSAHTQSSRQRGVINRNQSAIDSLQSDNAYIDMQIEERERELRERQEMANYQPPEGFVNQGPPSLAEMQRLENTDIMSFVNNNPQMRDLMTRRINLETQQSLANNSGNADAYSGTIALANRDLRDRSQDVDAMVERSIINQVGESGSSRSTTVQFGNISINVGSGSVDEMKAEIMRKFEEAMNETLRSVSEGRTVPAS